MKRFPRAFEATVTFSDLLADFEQSQIGAVGQKKIVLFARKRQNVVANRGAHGARR